MVQFLNNISFVEVGFWFFVITGVLHGVGVIFGDEPKEEKKGGEKNNEHRKGGCGYNQ